MNTENISVAQVKPGSFITGESAFAVPVRVAKAHRTRSRSRQIPEGLLKLALPLSILVVWEAVTRLSWVDPIFLPTPLSVAKAFYELLFKDRLWLDFRVSAVTVLEGFAIGAGFGLIAGVSAGLSSTFEKLLGSTLNSIRQVPPLAFLPLIVLWVGAGDCGKIVVISKAVFFPVFMNTLQGIRAVAKEYVEVGSIFEYSRFRLLRKVIIPAALPSIFVGLRYGAGLAWAMIIAAEMLGGRRGLGYLLTRSQELLLTDQLFLVIILIGLIGYVVDAGLRRLEKRLLRWRRGFEG